MASQDLQNRFDYHKPNAKKVLEHETVRMQVKSLAAEWDHSLPVGREQALALTKLEEAMFWANAAIARSNEGVKD
jgi:hypothetical protein